MGVDKTDKVLSEGLSDVCYLLHQISMELKINNMLTNPDKYVEYKQAIEKEFEDAEQNPKGDKSKS